MENQDQETDMAKGYRSGQKVQFKVGKGWGSGVIKGRSAEGDSYEIQTASGKTITRTSASMTFGPAVTPTTGPDTP